jgi:hypothetical protein
MISITGLPEAWQIESHQSFANIEARAKTASKQSADADRQFWRPKPNEK